MCGSVPSPFASFVAFSTVRQCEPNDRQAALKCFGIPRLLPALAKSFSRIHPISPFDPLPKFGPGGIQSRPGALQFLLECLSLQVLELGEAP